MNAGYTLLVDSSPSADVLNRLLVAGGERARDSDRWQRVLERSLWHLAVVNPAGDLVAFVRATSDLALNANLWDLCCDPSDPGCQEALAVLVHTGLGRLRRELSGCSISLSAPPEALRVLERYGFVVDPGGIRAMGIQLD